MNSLNLLSARVIGTSPSRKSPPKRARSYSEGNLKNQELEAPPKRSASQYLKREALPDDGFENDASSPEVDEKDDFDYEEKTCDPQDEKQPLLESPNSTKRTVSKQSRLGLFTKKLVDALSASLRWALALLTTPGIYIISSFYDDRDQFSPSNPFRKLSRITVGHGGQNSTAQAVGLSGSPGGRKGQTEKSSTTRGAKRKGPVHKSSLNQASGYKEEEERKEDLLDIPTEGQSRILTSSSSEDLPQIRRSVRIKSQHEDTTRRRKQRREKELLSQNSPPSLSVADIKSPTSPSSSTRATKYPRPPAPPRPLIPARQPSYSMQIPRNSRFARKTLVIDLDETLIHSLAKGGRMSSGHMVEVKLNTTVGIGGATLGPQHPILYYVHKRPHCDDFLRRICKWYNLVVFTASVQEYADPVIDWLEQERKYFSGRFYRQHCTFRNGAYIKDLSSVEPDLSKVMILDNSPLSYIFHEGMKSDCVPCNPHSFLSLTTFADNAIPIEGWINDPTDNDLLNLVPILEALQYVTDVRALLALRRGEGSATYQS